MSAPAGYRDNGNPYWIDVDGNRVSEDPNPQSATAAPMADPAPAPALHPLLQEAQRLDAGGQAPASPMTADALVDRLLQSITQTQYPSRLQGLLGAIPPLEAAAAGSPMAMSQAFAPDLASMQRNIQNVLAQNSRRFGPMGGGLLSLGREAGLLPIQQQAATLPGKLAQQGRQGLLDLATNTSIINPMASRVGSNNSTGTQTQGFDPYLQQSYGALGGGLGKLLGADMGGSTLGQTAWNWMFPTSTPSMTGGYGAGMVSASAPTYGVSNVGMGGGFAT